MKIKIALMLVWAVMSVVAFIAYGVDKSRAIRGKWRISEKTLLLLAFFMGAPGALVGMKVFSHKTKKPKFTIFVPLFLIIQAGALYYFFNR